MWAQNDRQVYANLQWCKLVKITRLKTDKRKIFTVFRFALDFDWEEWFNGANNEIRCQWSCAKGWFRKRGIKNEHKSSLTFIVFICFSLNKTTSLSRIMNIKWIRWKKNCSIKLKIAERRNFLVCTKMHEASQKVQKAIKRKKKKKEKIIKQTPPTYLILSLN